MCERRARWKSERHRDGRSAWRAAGGQEAKGFSAAVVFKRDWIRDEQGAMGIMGFTAV